MSNIRLSENMIGKKVRCIYKDGYYHPEVGTIGTIVRYDSYDENSSYKVQWPKGSTIGDDRWWVFNNCIELVEDNAVDKQKIPNMTSEEIWEMLKPKMEKNKLKSIGTCIKWKECVPEYFYTYSEDDVHNAIAIAYRSGYERAMKGRPFKIGEKKKKGGHWEPVDPENLPKEGTRVRYSRECKEYSDCKVPIIVLGDLGKVNITPEKWFGVRLDNPRSSFSWVSFDDSGIANCLDMWVEDDE